MTAPGDAAIEAVVRRDRLVVVVALALVTVMSWAYVMAGAGMGMSAFDMTRMSRSGADQMSMMTPAVWTASYAVVMFFMWWMMMIAMMLTSAAPMILLFATIYRRQAERGQPHVATSIFTAGYLAVWAGFSLVAVTAQWSLERAGILSPVLVGDNAVFAAVLLIAAGTYQLTPIKRACLQHCRTPASFLGAHWRPGPRGALRMGVVHGAYCVGCCWFLMGLLFFGGVMNLYWIGGLALFVLVERAMPAGHWVGRAIGIGLLGWGATLLAA